MRIFSLFNKNTRQNNNTTAGADTLAAEHSISIQSEKNNADFGTGTGTTRQKATVHNKTAMKIDAIESEMSSELICATTIIGTVPSETSTDKKITQPHALPTAINSTNDFLGGDIRTGSIEVSISDTPAVVEEAALLFANSQSDIAEQLLKEAIEEDSLGTATDIVWWMLLDLYLINGKQRQFDDLSDDFAHKFETSPPTWNKQLTLNPNTDLHANSSPVPVIPFSGKLDVHISKQLERAQKLSATHATLRLEFTQITSVDSVGCGLLLRMLKKLQHAGLDLILVGTTELADNIRAILSVGRRDETTAPWLLLLEILHLLNNEQAFEDVSIDYSITFEVSPPPFVSPMTKVTTANDETTSNNRSIKNQQYLHMPTLIEGRIDALLLQFEDHAKNHNPAMIDCSHLARVDFNAAGQLMNGLLPLTAHGRKIEFHHVNHLVAALFKVMGLYDVISIHTRKN